jgi:hypothetical protein
VSARIRSRQGFARLPKYRRAHHIRNFVPQSRFFSANPVDHSCETEDKKKAGIPKNRAFAENTCSIHGSI